MSERLYSDKIEADMNAYFEKYGWSLLRIAWVRKMLNDAFEEGKASSGKVITEEKK
jgi:hypothetical protein